MKEHNSQTDSDTHSVVGVDEDFKPWGTRLFHFLWSTVSPLATGIILVSVILIRLGLLPESFEQSTLIIIVGLVGIVFPIFYFLNWAAFTQMDSKLKYVARPLVLFLDGLILLAIGVLTDEWIRG